MCGTPNIKSDVSLYTNVTSDLTGSTDINKTSKHNYACMVKAAEAGTVFILQIAEYLSSD